MGNKSLSIATSLTATIHNICVRSRYQGGTSNCIPQFLWYVITCSLILASGTQRTLCVVIICHWYPFTAHSSIYMVHLTNGGLNKIAENLQKHLYTFFDSKFLPLKPVPENWIGKKSILVQEVFWYWTGTRPIPQQMKMQSTNAYRCHYDSMSRMVVTQYHIIRCPIGILS